MLYQLTYDRDDSRANEFRKKLDVPYSAGEFRVITLIAEDEEQALAIATKRLAKQYPDDQHVDVPGPEGVERVRVDGSEFNGQHRPDLAQSNYVLREIVALEVT